MFIKMAAVYSVAPGLVSFVFTCLLAIWMPKRSVPQRRDWGWLAGRAADAFSAVACLMFGIIALLTLVIAWFIHHEVAYGFGVSELLFGILIFVMRERRED